MPPLVAKENLVTTLCTPFGLVGSGFVKGAAVGVCYGYALLVCGVAGSLCCSCFEFAGC